MKAKKPLKKLVLTKESLHRLSKVELTEVVGAKPPSHVASQCLTCVTCYRTCTC